MQKRESGPNVTLENEGPEGAIHLPRGVGFEAGIWVVPPNSFTEPQPLGPKFIIPLLN